ncbi:unnamed protein product [Periconia digitata]|uniref:Uncharacterized protein n=1 Tax=Periconia digitata TaxID=1303443 RepID=A0A9W4U5L3_9PLEO|nr:unnamed protein product [Periconia digitata]
MSGAPERETGRGRYRGRESAGGRARGRGRGRGGQPENDTSVNSPNPPSSAPTHQSTSPLPGVSTHSSSTVPHPVHSASAWQSPNISGNSSGPLNTAPVRASTTLPQVLIPPLPPAPHPLNSASTWLPTSVSLNTYPRPISSSMYPSFYVTPQGPAQPPPQPQQHHYPVHHTPGIPQPHHPHPFQSQMSHPYQLHRNTSVGFGQGGAQPSNPPHPPNGPPSNISTISPLYTPQSIAPHAPGSRFDLAQSYPTPPRSSTSAHPPSAPASQNPQQMEQQQRTRPAPRPVSGEIRRPTIIPREPDSYPYDGLSATRTRRSSPTPNRGVPLVPWYHVDVPRNSGLIRVADLIADPINPAAAAPQTGEKGSGNGKGNGKGKDNDNDNGKYNRKRKRNSEEEDNCRDKDNSNSKGNGNGDGKDDDSGNGKYDGRKCLPMTLYLVGIPIERGNPDHAILEAKTDTGYGFQAMLLSEQELAKWWGALRRTTMKMMRRMMTSIISMMRRVMMRRVVMRRVMMRRVIMMRRMRITREQKIVMGSMVIDEWVKPTDSAVARDVFCNRWYREGREGR